MLLKSPEIKTPTDWSRDGRFLLFVSSERNTGWDIWYLPMRSEARESSVPQPQPIVYRKTRFDELAARFSPDGRFVAYTSTESGQREVYVQTFPDPNGGKWTVSKGGGESPRWRKDGKELFFLSHRQTGRVFEPRPSLMAVDVSTETSGAFKAGAQKTLFQFLPGSEAYDISADGQKVLTLTALPVPAAAQSTAVSSRPPITLVQNWLLLTRE
jgi:Tol biopolymer transport system component